MEGVDGLVILKGALDDEALGHLELAFFFVNDHFVGVDGYPSHEIDSINPDVEVPGASVTYHLFDGPGGSGPEQGDLGYPSTFFGVQNGRVFPDPNPPNQVYPIDPLVAEAFGVEDLGAEVGHR